MGRTANRRAANSANRALARFDRLQPRAITGLAESLGIYTSPANLPMPPMVECENCHARINVNSIQFGIGRCVCGATIQK